MRTRTGARRRIHWTLWVTLLVGVPLVVLLVWPQAFGVQRAPYATQVLAFRTPIALALAAGATLFAAVALLRKRWALAAGIAIVLAVASLGNGAVLVARGYGGSMPDGELTVLAWNTQGGASSPTEIAALVLRVEADIVSLPETDEAAVAEVARLVAEGGRAMTAGTAPGLTDPSMATSLLVADELGTYELDPTAGSTPSIPSGVWRPESGDGPTIVTAHPAPPLPAYLDAWREGLAWLATQCDAPDVILAGDLNATVDHLSGLGHDGGVLGGCRDAATEAGAGAVGTWPSTVPTWLATPIDHVLVGSGWTVRGVEVLTDQRVGSDHRPIVAVLDRR